MSDFNTDGLAEALPAVTNGSGPPKDQDAIELSRKSGWSAPEPIQYPRDNVADSQPAPGEVTNTESEWAHSAEKYEWKDEYGDVGPAITELEEQLFNKDYKPQIGDQLDKYAFLLLLSDVTDSFQVDYHPSHC